MPVSYGLVNPPSAQSAAAATNLPVPQGKQGDQIVSELNGKYYDRHFTTATRSSPQPLSVARRLFRSTRTPRSSA